MSIKPWSVQDANVVDMGSARNDFSAWSTTRVKFWNEMEYYKPAKFYSEFLLKTIPRMREKDGRVLLYSLRAIREHSSISCNFHNLHFFEEQNMTMTW